MPLPSHLLSRLLTPHADFAKRRFLKFFILPLPISTEGTGSTGSRYGRREARRCRVCHAHVFTQ